MICLSNKRELELNYHFIWKHHLPGKNPPQAKEGRKIVFEKPASVIFDIKINKIDVSAIKMIIINEADELLLPQATQKMELIALLNNIKEFS